MAEDDKFGPSMFQSIGGVGKSMLDGMKPNQFGPAPEEMEEGLKRVQFKKHVDFQDHKVQIYDLHDPKSRKAYEKNFRVLIQGVQAGTHQIWDNERQLLIRPDGSQGWHRYVEWSEFALKVDPTIPVGTP